MSDPFARLRRFLRELKRRNVYKVAVAYLGVAFVVVQGARLLVPALVLPEWFYRVVVALALLGFPLALVLAWAFEMTPEGMRRTEALEGEEVGGSTAYQWIGLAVVVLLAGGVWYATAGGGGEPSAETSAAADTAQTTEAPANRFVSRDRPFVAVLPLENLSPKEENKFFAAGIHEEILNQLSKVSGLGVFARTTMRQYADTEKSVYQIGEELGAQAVLEGSVRRAGNRVRISAQLIDPESRDHLWSETFERQLSTDAVFDIQSQIAEKVTSALEAELTAGERESIQQPPTPDLAAYDAYVKGREYIWESASAGATVFQMDTAVVVLREALKKDSTFAAAHGLLGFAYGLRFDFTGTSRWLDSARVSIARADSLQPGLVQTHLARGVVRSATEDYAEAEKDLRAVLSQQPDHGFALMEMSEIHRDRGEHAEALRWALRAARQDPRNVAYVVRVMRVLRPLEYYEAAEAWYHHGVRHHPENSLLHLELARIQADRGQYQASYQTATQALEWHPKVIRLHREAGAARLQLGRLDEARDHLERARELEERRHRRSPGFPDFEQPMLGYTYLRLGEEERGRRLLEEAASFQPDVYSRGERWAYSATVQSALGNPAAARDDLRRALGAGWVGSLGSPLFDSVRAERWFQQLRRQVQSKLQAQREQVRQLELDLYPPGTQPHTASQKTEADE